MRTLPSSHLDMSTVANWHASQKTKNNNNKMANIVDPNMTALAVISASTLFANVSVLIDWANRVKETCK